MSQQTGRLAGKTAVVTGAASGIGLAVTQLFLSEGAKVLAVDFSDKNIESAKSQLQADGFDSGSYTFHNADVADEESVIAFVEKGVTELGGLDIVVLNAGIGFIKPIVDTNAEEYDRLMRINARGPFLGVKYAAEKMKSLGNGGSIIITASLASEAAYGELSAYNMSKFAVRALSVTAAQEYAKHKIRVNTVSPSFVATPLVTLWGDLEERVKATTVGRTLEPSEVAKLFLFLASDDAKMVSGSNYRMDGGMLLH
ncbi:uncharacterized protein PV06_05546 [Exophiala oligosperma]|uniref:Uncharacterized protein n=2 Tax=Chaetothyriales TaxID=34395 RepID=A0A0D2BWU6_9EURO|nr:uncharacterized protein PV06_05546 [Exophiala oligosperma]KAJ9643184.1 hypothetical protein H2204_002079 [Knufia peltigerae]KIW41952.1 hypothetical protein PV06_05546 [Exophiala oligosperma]